MSNRMGGSVDQNANLLGSALSSHGDVVDKKASKISMRPDPARAAIALSWLKGELGTEEMHAYGQQWGFKPDSGGKMTAAAINNAVRHLRACYKAGLIEIA